MDLNLAVNKTVYPPLPSHHSRISPGGGLNALSYKRNQKRQLNLDAVFSFFFQNMGNMCGRVAWSNFGHCPGTTGLCPSSLSSLMDMDGLCELHMYLMSLVSIDWVIFLSLSGAK